jgi:hypothetical protein
MAGEGPPSMPFGADEGVNADHRRLDERARA